MPISPTHTFSGKFLLSVTEALREQLADALQTLTDTPLTTANIALVEDVCGVYQLYENGKFAYVGKAEALRTRLTEHLDTLRGRLHVGSVSFTCLEMAEDLPAMAPERLLIDWHKKRGEIPWNTSGIGNHDPGGKRDTTEWGPDHFYTLHPIDLDFEVSDLPTAPTSLSVVLAATKKALPYTFRYKYRNDAAAKALYKSIPITLPAATMTAAEIFEAVAAVLPAGWQITASVAYVIMYDEVFDAPTALKVCRSPGSTP